MEHINYFKLQAKNLFKDYKTRYFNEKDGVYDYHSVYFDISDVFFYLEYKDSDEHFSFTLMNAQHVIANLAGYEKWNDLLKASNDELDLAHLLFDNAHKISLEEWYLYITDAERSNRRVFDTRTKIEIFEQVFLSTDSHRSDYEPFRFDLRKKWISPPADIVEEDYQKPLLVYEELNEQEKSEALQNPEINVFGYNLEDVVECIHCSARYRFKEVKVIRAIPQDHMSDRNPMVVCKKHPKCNGEVLDIHKVKRNE